LHADYTGFADKTLGQICENPVHPPDQRSIISNARLFCLLFNRFGFDPEFVRSRFVAH
jgi:hypothetical protein